MSFIQQWFIVNGRTSSPCSRKSGRNLSLCNRRNGRNSPLGCSKDHQLFWITFNWSLLLTVHIFALKSLTSRFITRKTLRMVLIHNLWTISHHLLIVKLQINPVHMVIQDACKTQHLCLSIQITVARIVSWIWLMFCPSL